MSQTIASPAPRSRAQSQPRSGAMIATPTSGCVARGMMRFIGVTLALAAVGIWLVPGAVWDGEQVLVKLSVSVFFVGCGVAMLQTGRDKGQDEFHVDRRAGELRHVLRGCDGIARVQDSFVLASIGAVTLADGLLTIRGKDDSILLKMPIKSAEAMRMMEMALEQGGVRIG